MKHLKRYSSFSSIEQMALKSIESLGEENLSEGIRDWISKAKDFFEGLNDAIRNLMLAMMEKGIQSLYLIKSLFSKILDRAREFKEKNPILFRIAATTLVLLVLLFVLCSAAASPEKRPNAYVINAAIGLLDEIRRGGESDIEGGILMKAQAYLFELKNSGKELAVGEDAVKAADAALKIIHQNISDYKASGGKDVQGAEYLLKLAEQGAKMVGYKIKEFSDITGTYSGSDISLGFK